MVAFIILPGRVAKLLLSIVALVSQRHELSTTPEGTPLLVNPRTHRVCIETLPACREDPSGVLHRAYVFRHEA